ncbi:MAG: hypothetical protein ACK4ND_17870 [Cytophagaceae bacterium]
MKYTGTIVDILVKDGILYGVYKKEFIGIEEAKLATEERLKFINKEVYPWHIDYARVKHTTREARIYFAEGAATEHIKAVAFIINSPVGAMMGNFFSFVNKPPYPFKIFVQARKAEKWLQRYK